MYLSEIKIGQRVFICRATCRRLYPNYILPPKFMGIGIVRGIISHYVVALEFVDKVVENFTIDVLVAAD